jgi:hypothetical protein
MPRVTHHDGSVVDENIDPAPGLDDLLNNSVTALFVPDVLGEQKTFSTVSDDKLLGLFSINLLLWQVDDCDLLCQSYIETESKRYSRRRPPYRT